MKSTERNLELAFTFIELLVVIAVFGMLVCVLGAGRGINRGSSNAFQCLNNHRRLMAAWKMYADDNAGALVYNRDGTAAGKSAGSECWVAGWMDFSASTDNTNINLLVRHDITPYGAYLGPYAKSPSIFKCPADKATAPIAGKPTFRVRSVSMNNFFGFNSRSWTTPSRYTLYSRLNQVKSPATLFVFLDEHPNSINDGLFFTDPDTQYQMIDYPASWHDSAGAFSFVDGRAEIHRWSDPRTMPAFQQGQLLLLNINLPGDVDVTWLQQHASELR
jgi:prepilin-type N-terminal cleavage/methylation domain-containing protein